MENVVNLVETEILKSGEVKLLFCKMIMFIQNYNYLIMKLIFGINIFYNFFLKYLLTIFNFYSII